MELSKEMDGEIIDLLCGYLDLDPEYVFYNYTPLDLSFIFTIQDILRRETDLFFDNGKEFGVWDVTHEKGIDIGKLVESGMKLFRKSAPRPPVKDEEILAHIKEEKMRNNSEKSHNEELKEKIQQRKEEELKKRMALKNEFKNEVSRENENADSAKKKTLDPELRERMANMFDRGRD